jgi:GDP-4-dehydro-6-deoxy-D-mannose reductase
MRVLVTGAGDYLGGRLLDALGANVPPGGRVLGIDCGPQVRPPARAGIACTVVDPLDAAAVTNAVAGLDPTVVVHLAALASVAESSRWPERAWRADLLGSLNLAEAVARTCRAARFVFVSSTEVYGEAAARGGPIDETTAPRPCNIFGRTKTASEAILRDVLTSARVGHAVLRPSNYIGPGQSEVFVASSFAAQIARIERGLAPAVLEVGDLTVARDFIDVADVTAACLAAIAAGADLPDGGVFNVSSGVATPISGILDALRGLARVPFEVRVVQDRLRPAEVRSVACNASAFAAATGWRPRVPLAESLAAILEDARARA